MATATKIPAAEINLMEDHDTTEELAIKWHVSDEKICRLFADEPDVIRIGNIRRMMRIPESVALRVYNRLKNK